MPEEEEDEDKDTSEDGVEVEEEKEKKTPKTEKVTSHSYFRKHFSLKVCNSIQTRWISGTGTASTAT